MATAAPCVAVIDGDMQHDERILPEMLRTLRTGNLDFVIGTRNAEGGSMGDFSASRIRLSNLGKQMGIWLTGVQLSDPMSGFFLVDKRWLETVVHLTSAVGFKVLLDLVASAHTKPSFAEVPYTFRSRQHGESKLDILVGLEYLQLLLDKSAGRYIPLKFMLFSLVGGVGLIAALALEWFSVQVMQFSLESSHYAVTALAMVLNFFLNNILTYRSQRLKGWQMWRGLVLFVTACSAGFWLNLQIFEGALRGGTPWAVASALGLVVGGVWNYAVAGAFTWRGRRKAQRRRTERIHAHEVPAIK